MTSTRAIFSNGKLKTPISRCVQAVTLFIFLAALTPAVCTAQASADAQAKQRDYDAKMKAISAISTEAGKACNVSPTEITFFGPMVQLGKPFPTDDFIRSWIARETAPDAMAKRRVVNGVQCWNQDRLERLAWASQAAAIASARISGQLK